jgi:glutamine synthetase
MQKDQDYILKLANEHKVKFVKLWFTDTLGLLKSFAITIEELEDALSEGVRFDGATLSGFVRSEEQELIALPDPSTFQILPWRPKEDAVARIFCDIVTNDLKPYDGDSRYILRRTLQAAAEKGYTFYTGPEIEFFFFSSFNAPEAIDQGGYFDLTPLDSASDYRRDTVLTLEKLGIDVISSHHEGAPSQHEIDLRHEDALTTADNIMTFRVVAKEIAQKNGIYASFMPKPKVDQNGSGMHIHLSLFKNDQNIFFDKKAPDHLSADGRHFIAGLLNHAKEYFAVTNQWINSYKRFHSGFEAPTRISWSGGDNTAFIRIPKCREDKPNSMRVELRTPDPACNPYLALSAILAAGLKGIEEKAELYADDGSEKYHIPSSLSEAFQYFEKSELMRKTFGDTIMNRMCENKRSEIVRYNSYVTDYELKTYLPIL